MTTTPITPELIAQALQYIPANLPRDEWARVAMAIKSEFADATGFELFDTWSATAESYDKHATASTWRSIKAGGGVGIGTLLHLAKEHGFERPRVDQPATRPSPEAQARQAEERARRERQERAKIEAAQAEAAAKAATQWTQAQPLPEGPNGHPYLERKGVQAHGLRVASDGCLLVPVRDEAGALCNVQRIQPHKPVNGPDKLFLKGGRKSGCWHLLGAISDAASGGDPAGAGGAEPVILLAEGYATAATLHEATGRPVACAFDAGNLKHVAQALRRRHPLALLVVCGDDDRHNPSGTNPGHDKATAAARAVDGLAVFPSTLPEGGSDFNDMAQHMGGVVGLEAITRNAEGTGWGYLLTFTDPLGRQQQWAMPSRMLAGDGGEYRSMLLDRGLRIAPSPRARNLLTQYIQTRQPDEHALCTDRVGWHGASFVLPHETIGTPEAERIVFQSDSAMENTFRPKGTVEQWRGRVASLCVGNSRLAFAVACAFAGPLLRPAGVESGGFHLRGDSSSGKTTALRVAASVYGGTSYMQRWRTTDNALEAIAAQHSDCLLILDELAQVDPKTAGECAYMLANEQSKARATRNGASRARLSWRLLFLSAGELGLADHMAEGMKRTRTGQEVRMADIPADAGVGLGAFEELHGCANGAEFSRLVAGHAGTVHGAVGRAWLQWLADHADTLKTRTRKAAADLARQWVPKGASGQVERVAARFAVVAVAGEMATEAGLTDWPMGESERAAKTCFDAWLGARGGAGNGEVSAMLRQVRRFLEQHGEGRSTWWHRAADDHNAKTLQRAGYRRMVTEDGTPIKSDADHQREYGERMTPVSGADVQVEYFILPETFKAEVCHGFEAQAVAKVLESVGCLNVKEPGRFSTKHRLPGLGNARAYHILPSLFELDV